MATKKSTRQKRRAWLKYYLEEGTPTFLNATASAEKAAYRATKRSFRQIGYLNLKLFANEIEAWLDEHGFSDARLKTKLLELVEAKQTIYQKVKGAIKADDLPAGHRLVVSSGLLEFDKEGKGVFGTGDTLIEIDVVALETQRRSLDMAFKVKGLYAPEKKEHTGKDGKPIQHDVNLKADMNLSALQEAIRKDQETR